VGRSGYKWQKVAKSPENCFEVGIVGVAGDVGKDLLD